jgi:hypothetical protein
MGYAGTDIDGEIAARIRAAVAEAGVSERSVFIAAGVPDGTWHRCVRLGVGGLRVAQVVRIAQALKVPTSSLVPELEPVVSA